MSNNKQYLFEGKIDHLKNKKLVNEDILKDIRKAGAKDFDDSVIEFKAADEKYVIHVFTDTSCGYCRKLHNENGGSKQSRYYRTLPRFPTRWHPVGNL